jgi:hypothetical protein
MTSKQSFALLFSTLIAGLVSSEFTLKVAPVPYASVDNDGTIFLHPDSTLLLDPQNIAECADSEGPFGKSGNVETNGEADALAISFALPSMTQLKTNNPKSAKFQLTFENDDCDEDKTNYDGNLTKTRTGVSEGSLPPLVVISSCYLFVDVDLSFEGCQNWHGGEGPVFELKVELDGDAPLGESYKFVPCRSYIEFEFFSTRRNLGGISYVEDCPYVMNEDGSCQVCPTSDASAALKPHILGVAILAFAQFLFLVS